VVSGQLIHIGKFVGVCAYDAASGQQCEVGVMGRVFVAQGSRRQLQPGRCARYEHKRPGWGDKTGNVVCGVCATPPLITLAGTAGIGWVGQRRRGVDHCARAAVPKRGRYAYGGGRT